MRLFGRKATITAPDGREWELYVNRISGPRWQPRDYDSPAELTIWNWSPSGSALLVLLEIPLFVYNCLLVPAVSYLFSLPAAVVRSRRSGTWTVEAVCWWPHEQRFQWSVGESERERVTEAVAQGIEEGRWAQPPGAVFHGEVAR